MQPSRYARQTAVVVTGLCVVIATAVLSVGGDVDAGKPRPGRSLDREPPDTIDAVSIVSGSPSTRFRVDGTAPQLHRQSRQRMHGHVLGSDGHARPGVALRIDGAVTDSGVVSDGQGRFEFFSTRPHPLVVTNDERWITVRAGSRDGDSGTFVIVAPRIQVEGVVCVVGGEPVESATLAVSLAGAMDALDSDVLGATMPHRWSAISEANGSFRFAEVPSLPGARLEVRARGFCTARVPLPQVEQGRLRIWLEPRGSRQLVVAGRVIDHRGEVAGGSKVALGTASVRVDSDGRFELICPWTSPTAALIASRGSEVPGVIENFGAILADRGSNLPPVELRLGGPSCSIRGRLVASDGTSRKDWSIAIIDAGQEMLGTESARTSSRPVEPIHADRDGRFEITGLAPGLYTLRVWSSRDFGFLRFPDISSPGTGVRLALPGASSVGTVSGQVRDRDGKPLAGIRVAVARVGSDANSVAMRIAGMDVTTDRAGRFELPNAPGPWCDLVVRGDHVLPTRATVAPDERRSVGIRLELRRRIRFVGAQRTGGNETIRVVDGHGHAVPLWRVSQHHAISRESIVLDNSGTAEFAIGATGSTLLLLRGREELGRISLAAQPRDLVVYWP